MDNKQNGREIMDTK